MLACRHPLKPFELQSHYQIQIQTKPRFQNPSYHRFQGLFRLEDGDGAGGRALVGHLEARRQLVSHEGPTIPEGHLRKQHCQRDAAKGREGEYEEKGIFA